MKHAKSWRKMCDNDELIVRGFYIVLLCREINSFKNLFHIYLSTKSFSALKNLNPFIIQVDFGFSNNKLEAAQDLIEL